MKLENIYEILKNASLEQFYTPDKGNYPFIYMNDVNLIIEQSEDKEDKDVFGFDYFHNADRTPKTNLTADDQLVYDVAKQKNFPETFNRMKIVTYDVKYSGMVIYELEYIMISNLSSLHMMIPLNLNPFDYQYNLCELYNEKHSPNQHFGLEERLNIKTSRFDDFVFR